MDVTPLVRAGQQIIQSYASGGFTVSGTRYESAVFVFPDKTVEWEFNGGVDALSEADFDVLSAQSDEIDVVLLGCGANIAFLSQPLKNSLKNKGLSVDVMDSGAACRTYNVLMAEGRRVVAALLPV